MIQAKQALLAALADSLQEIAPGSNAAAAARARTWPAYSGVGTTLPASDSPRVLSISSAKYTVP